ncbi:MAG: [FeFe] hydrogenase H-cluster radical SAM maturase HydE [Kiritimatiellae bacterium]|nr:[FeFe] hydrogenase H-cluster radical SAM maturase HydE [Kiritimatiellia bacterium]MDD4736273.1 [FeFe] hydrogenase H-cluster radical SAM maturase HydE [Kiritimatiellia bacterium]
MATKNELIEMLATSSPDAIENLRQHAYQIMKDHVGELVYYRGIIELSNICTLNCHYCGIRRSNTAAQRYELDDEQVIEAAIWCAKQGYGSIVIQSGERRNHAFTARITRLVLEIKRKSISEKLPNGLGITLSLGEQSPATYRQWFNAGAHRYLLRIESTNQALFAALHPPAQQLDQRLQALHDLRDEGYQVGTGVMIGLPGQTLEMLADDILFFRDSDIDMIGMGPFIPHAQTPMSTEALGNTLRSKEERLQLALNMIAATRIACPDINIASTTALQAIVPDGREQGLTYGANVTMPNLTPAEVRKDYTLYDGKPCLDESKTECRTCLLRRIQSTGRQVGFDQWGDSLHFAHRTKTQPPH